LESAQRLLQEQSCVQIVCRLIERHSIKHRLFDPLGWRLA
jgi:hypothetical protein